MEKSLNGRVALVTGASSGIGEATALTFAKAGAKVAIAARRKDRLEAVARRIRDLGGDALVVEADFASEAHAQQAVKQTEQHFGRLDILVNNAGVMYLEPIIEADLGRWRHMFELNVLGLIAATQAALRGMKERRDGHIVNVSSVAGRFANPMGGAYSATKFGVAAFSEALRKEVYKDNIRVTVIEPGLVDTELRDHIAHDGVKNAIKNWAEGLRQLKSENIARAILFAVAQPAHVNVNEILIRPTDQ